jgi:hypothetical protein
MRRLCVVSVVALVSADWTSVGPATSAPVNNKIAVLDSMQPFTLHLLFKRAQNEF